MSRTTVGWLLLTVLCLHGSIQWMPSVLAHPNQPSTCCGGDCRCGATCPCQARSAPPPREPHVAPAIAAVTQERVVALPGSVLVGVEMAPRHPARVGDRSTRLASGGGGRLTLLEKHVLRT